MRDQGLRTEMCICALVSHVHGIPALSSISSHSNISGALKFLLKVRLIHPLFCNLMKPSSCLSLEKKT
jgi:hypothetical protein